MGEHFVIGGKVLAEIGDALDSIENYAVGIKVNSQAPTMARNSADCILEKAREIRGILDDETEGVEEVLEDEMDLDWGGPPLELHSSDGFGSRRTTTYLFPDDVMSVVVSPGGPGEGEASDLTLFLDHSTQIHLTHVQNVEVEEFLRVWKGEA